MVTFAGTFLVLSVSALPATQDVLKDLRGIESASMRGKSDETRAAYKRKLEESPNDVMLRLYHAWVDMPSEDAWNQLKSISAIEPENPWPQLGMARVFVKWKMKDQAKPALDGILKRDPTFFPAMVALGRMALAADDLSEASKQFRAALAVADDAEAHEGLGRLALVEGKKDEALSRFEKAVAAWPDQPQALRELMKMYSARGDDVKATEAASRLADLQPRDREARKSVADARFNAGEFAKAAEEYERLVRLGDAAPATVERLANLYRDLKNVEGEERALNLWQNLQPDNVDAPVRGGQLLEAKGNLEGAEKRYLEATARDPKRAYAQVALARVKVKRGLWHEAVDAYRAAMQGEGPSVAEAKTEGAALEKKLDLGRPARGDVNAIYGNVAYTLNTFYAKRKREKPALAGEIKLRVKVDATGKVKAVEVVSDTAGDPALLAHAYFGVKDAVYPKKRSEPLFEFVVGKVKKGS